jgi:RNA exonuclease 4
MAAASVSKPEVIALDCEMIGLGYRSYLARVTIVGRDGRVLLDRFVKPPILRNTTSRINYRTAISGVTKNILDKRGQFFPKVQTDVLRLLEGKIIVGHGLANDFKALQIPDWQTRYVYYDTTEIPFFMRVVSREGHPDRFQPRKLKDLASEFLGKTIQVEGVPHDSAEDARTVIELYERYPEAFTAAAPRPSLRNTNVRNTHTRKRTRRV